jgi:hypothetical protein
MMRPCRGWHEQPRQVAARTASDTAGTLSPGLKRRSWNRSAHQTSMVSMVSRPMDGRGR